MPAATAAARPRSSPQIDGDRPAWLSTINLAAAGGRQEQIGSALGTVGSGSRPSPPPYTAPSPLLIQGTPRDPSRSARAEPVPAIRGEGKQASLLCTAWKINRH